MPLVDSRLGVGTLTIDAKDFSYQAANVALEPDVTDEDGTPTLAEPDPAPLAEVAWNLTGSVIQDFGEPMGFLNYLMDNALDEVPFVFTPNTTEGTSYTGMCQLRPATVGGDAGVQITSDFELPVVGEILRTDGVATAREAKKTKSD